MLNLLVLLTLLRPSINVMFTAIILYDSCVGGIIFFPSKISVALHNPSTSGASFHQI